MTDMKDEQLKQLFKETLPEVPRNPWFVKKVMNRLPEKRSASSYSWIEYGAYILAVLLLGGFGLYQGYGLTKVAEVTIGDVFYLLAIGAVMIGISIGFFFPLFRQWISED